VGAFLYALKVERVLNTVRTIIEVIAYQEFLSRPLIAEFSIGPEPHSHKHPGLTTLHCVMPSSKRVSPFSGRGSFQVVIQLKFVLLLFWLYAASALQLIQGHVVVAGATGYIGRAVVKELTSRGVKTTALVRNEADISSLTRTYLNKAEILQLNLLSPETVNDCFEQIRPSAVICCAASRNGLPKESWEVDYGVGKMLMEALCKSTPKPQKPHFVMLSAFCCGKPILQFQFAKLKLEEELRSASERLSHSIVRPTAYFKSLDGQIEAARKGSPVMYFGDGSCSANAIDAQDLAVFMVDCALSPSDIGMLDATRNIGGPDVPALTKLEQIDKLFDAVGTPVDRRKKMSLPVGIFDVFIALFSAARSVTEALGARNLTAKCEDAVEIVQIVKYYATEPMVAVQEGEVYGKITLKDHFVAMGGQLREVDKLTTTAGVVDLLLKNKYDTAKVVEVEKVSSE